MPPRLSPTDLTALLSRHRISPKTGAILGLDASPTALALGRVLAATHPLLTPVVAPPTAAAATAARAALPNAHVAAPGLARGASMRVFAAAAVGADVRTLVLPGGLVDAAAAGVGLACGETGAGRGLRLSCGVRGGIEGCEMLPPGVLDAVRPFRGVGPEALDGLVGGDRERERARAMFGGADLRALAAMGERRVGALRELREAGDRLLWDAVVEMNHWGFVALSKAAMQRAYEDVAGGGREIAVDVLARLMMHVSGIGRETSFATQAVQELAEGMLGGGARMGKGHTFCGVLVRPASGPRAAGLYQRHVRRKQMLARNEDARGGRRGGGHGGVSRYGDASAEDGAQLVFLSREPDREASHIVGTRRMGGNVSAMPVLLGDDHAVYWDNRYVIRAVNADELAPNSPMISDKAVLLAALRVDDNFDNQVWSDANFYVRQLRNVDYEYMNTSKVDLRSRHFKAPYQCIRGLPALYQKEVGDTKNGVLAAVPHLGLSGRPDIIFTAVRLPRFRCIPVELEPGFSCLPVFPSSGGLEGRAAAGRSRLAVN